MFALRAIAATLSLFAIVYLLASAIVALGWRLVPKVLKDSSSVALSRSLYFLRIAPLSCAALAALIYELPSFLQFEPRAANEGLALLPLVFSILVLLGTVAALWQMTAACRRTAQLCRELGRSKSTTDGVPVFESGSAGPPVAVAGAFEQRLLLSETVSAVLDKEELDLALAHELGHIRSRDNLRKLMLLACRFPGMHSLEQAWADAAEFAADERAVDNQREALTLASAIVKVAGLHLPPADAEVLVTNFVGAAPSVALRVQKLSAWEKTAPANTSARMLGAVALTLGTTALAVSYPAVLSLLHAVTEFLFR